METVSCPICKKSMFHNPRYPNEVCKYCVAHATDGHGRFLKFYNRTISDGYIAFYADADGKEEYRSSACFINKKKCCAKEAKFGGIVVELVQMNPKKDKKLSPHKDLESTIRNRN